MSFFGIEFLVFFLVVAGLHFTLPVKYRCLFLLLASYFFYWTWQPVYLLLLIGSTTCDYFIALKIGPGVESTRQKIWFITGIVLSLGLLVFFKYFNFFNDFFRYIFTGLKLSYPVPQLNIILPLGISYYLFKKISYLTDVYRGHIEAERSFIRCALYVSFFPEIVAGPIDRAGSLLSQFLEKHKIDFSRVSEGLQLVFWGLFKKFVIADRLSILVNVVFDQPLQHGGAVIGLATLFYGFQIYCDFSGYSDIAIGLGRILGFTFMDNFKQPYLAESTADFWKRWHISLSNWLRDYLFLPISYFLTRNIDRGKWTVKRPDKWAYVSGVSLTMLLCGLWHGANRTFAAWGLVHGFFLAISFLTRKARKRAVKYLRLKKMPGFYKSVKILLTFILISFSWLLFRAKSMADAFTLTSRLFFPGPVATGRHSAIKESLIVGLSLPNFIIAVVAIFLLVVVEFILEKKDIPAYRLLTDKPLWLRWTVYYLVIFSILLFGIYGQQEFIYGRF